MTPDPAPLFSEQARDEAMQPLINALRARGWRAITADARAIFEVVAASPGVRREVEALRLAAAQSGTAAARELEALRAEFAKIRSIANANRGVSLAAQESRDAAMAEANELRSERNRLAAALEEAERRIAVASALLASWKPDTQGDKACLGVVRAALAGDGNPATD